MNTVSVFGIRIDSLSAESAVQQLDVFLSSGSSERPHMIVTPNPEILLYARAHPDYRDALNRSDLALPDGSGLRLVKGIEHTVHGSDIARVLVEKANTKRMKVACVVRQDGRSTPDQVKRAVQAMAVHSEVAVFALQKEGWKESAVLQALQEFSPDILFVGLGFPEQELFLNTILVHITSARIGMSVGGTFDFWTGVAKRAPRMIRSLHLEWLWRVILEPRRIGRIFRAVVVFPFFILFTASKHK